MRTDDPADVIAWELIAAHVTPPSDFKEASKWVAYNCNHLSIVQRAEVICALMDARKDYDERLARVEAQLAKERHERKNPYHDHPTFGTWG